MASITALPTVTTSVIITTMATSTYALIITIIIFVVIASTEGVKLPMVALVLPLIIILLASSPLLGTYIRLSATALLAPVGSVASIIAPIVFIMIVIICLFSVPLLLGGGGVAEAAVEISVCLYMISFPLYLLYF